MPDAEGAVERLYEDPDVRDELRDDEANLLLKWAEDQLYRLAEQSTDADFDERAARFRALLKGMNRLVGSRTTLDAADLSLRLGDLAAQAASVTASGAQFDAQAAPASIPADQLADVAGKLPSLDDSSAVTALTTLFTPGNAPSAEATAPPATPAQPSDADQSGDTDGMLYLPSLTDIFEEPHADDPTP